MVNHTALESVSEEIDDECPNTDYGNSTVSIEWNSVINNICLCFC